MLDTNTWTGRWYNQKFLAETAGQLRINLQSAGITKAFISSTDAVFSSDPQPWNQELARVLVGDQDFFVHAPVVNPNLANWERTLACYASALPVRALRLLPGYHGYSMTSRNLYPFFRMCSQLAFTVMIQVRMEDERGHHKQLRVEAVSTEKIIELAASFPEISFLCLCVYFPEAVALCGPGRNLCVDISFVEKMNTLAQLTAKVPVSKIVFGSHSPFLYTEGAVLKMKYAEVGLQEKQQIMYENASRFFSLADCRT